eukprot:Amastigsp_a844434_371.p1 type:complete len:233 gc:universal Amastigsp_a844434_371:121-819(+)
MASALDDNALNELYVWVDEVPLSRPKRNIARDFADGVLYAELVHHYFPKLVELHNYSAAHATQQKLYNWKTLNQKVLKRLGLRLTQDEINEIVTATPGAVEAALLKLKRKMDEHMARHEGTEEMLSEDASDVQQQVDQPRRAGSRTSVAAPAPEAKRAPKQQQQQQQAAGDASLATDPHAIDTELLVEKERTIVQLREIIKILERKMMKLEKLVELKNEKIQSLQEQVARQR